MKMNKAGLDLIKDFEKCKLEAYPDRMSPLAKACRLAGVIIYQFQKLPGWQSLKGHPWTIGWGHTGPEVHPGLVWTQEKADAVFVADLKERELIVKRLAKANKVGRLPPNQFSVLVSFVYNCGFLPVKNLFKNCITVDDTGEAKLDPKQVAQYLALYSHADGKEVPGLARRRKEEAELFLTEEMA